MTVLDHVSQQLLVPAGLDTATLEKVLGKVLASRIDYADLYCQSVISETWALEEGVVKTGNYEAARGVGIRAVDGETTGFSYADNLVLPALTEAAQAAKCIARQGGQLTKTHPVLTKPSQSLYVHDNPLSSFSEKKKINLLMRLDKIAREEDPRVKQVNIGLSATHEHVLVMASDGTLAADIRPMVRLNVSVVAEQDGRREHGYQGMGGRYTYDELFQGDQGPGVVKKAVREALINLEAQDAPAGSMPVVLGPGWPGVLLHEAVGHGLEADFNRKGHSAFSGRLGERVASSLCTVVDNGALEGRRGSLNVDDEGVATQETVLIEQGILKNYMQDKLSARLMKMSLTGNGRRQSYMHVPMPRMTNTYMLAGQSDSREIISQVKKGLYAVNFSGGQVDITNGQFVFSASEAYLIENGKIKYPVRGATLIGSGPEVLKKVSMVGNDLQLDRGVGICGKDGQSVPVSVGQPTLLVDELTVGGTGV